MRSIVTVAAALFLWVSGVEAQRGITVGLPLADSFTFVTAGDSFAASIPLIAADSAVSFLLSWTPARSAAGRETAIDLEVRDAAAQPGGGWLLPARSAATLVLSARLPEPGAYRGAFTIRVGAGAVTRAYTVRWDRAPIAAAIIVPGGVLSSRGRGAVVPFSVRDSGTAQIRARVTIDSLRLLHSADVALAPSPGRITLHEAGVDSAIEELQLGTGRTRPLELRITGLDEPGSYAGTIRLETSGLSGVATPVRIYVRRSMLFAAVIIFAGILLAEALRRYNERTRPKLDRQRRLAAQMEALQTLEQRLRQGTTPADPVELQMIETLRDRMMALYGDPELPTITDADARITDLKSRLDLLPRWINERRKLAAVPASIRDELEQSIAPARELLEHDGLGSDALRTAARTALDGLKDRIETALTRLTRDRIAVFRAQVENAGLGPAVKTTTDALTAAAAKLDGGDRDAAEELLEAARVLYADVLAAALKTRLAQKPSWVTQQVWDSTTNPIATALAALPADGEPRVQAVSDAFLAYLTAASDSLATTAAGLASAGGLPADQQAQLEAARDRANAARVAIAGKDTAAAAAELEAGRAAWERYQELKTGTLSAQAAAHPTVPAAIPRGQQKGVALLSVAPAPAIATARELEQEIGMWDWAVTLVSAVLAMLFGINLLWIPDLTWGSAADIAVAFFWGLGLQQVGNQSFRGLAQFVKRIHTDS